MKGIKNIGNTCYVNCVLQILSYNFNFVDYLNKNITFILNKINNNETSLFIELYKIIKELNTKNDITSIIPKSFLQHLEKIWNTPIFIQQDSSDLLQLLIDNCITFFNTNLTYNKVDDDCFDNRAYNKSNENKLNTFKNQYSEFNKVFYGQKMYLITCIECNHIEYLFEVFNILNIPINDSKTLEECLDKYFNNFKVDDYVCEKCKCSDVVHKYYIWELPEILTISFKRFDNNLNKINTLIQLDNNITLKKYMFEHRRIISKDYNLYSIINHLGNYNGGHYISLIKNNKKWFAIDDDCISKTAPDKVNSLDNYIIMYNSV
jgi:ubiquitin C-terminal hydrolase